MDSHDVWIKECHKLDFFPSPRKYKEGTKTSEEAAKQLGCEVSNIAKSIVFMGKDCAIIVITSGSNRVDRKKKLSKILGYKPGQASPKYVLDNTGYEIGGIPPFGHLKRCIVMCDEDLLKYDIVWGAGGTHDTVFPISPADLVKISRATVVDIKQ
ncbi:MAG: hypothetical protein CMB47_04750 [Euryarchaeota archaeon]|nr:hypothetical protein [Euryarchaeota archaeon]|tara:strand:- start:3521 stop:3985 length:465 start_codon:yes stop_codon:yes gene_type:complete